MDHEFMAKSQALRPKIRDVFEFHENLQIGRGSYGVVYKIHRKDQTPANRKYYALKVIELIPYSPSACREISIYREIVHRNIMTLLQVFFSHSTKKACLLFDYAEYDLHTIIRYYRNLNKRMPISLTKSCLRQILLGVDYLHNNWILHRDLKPENILVMGDGIERGCIKITDMGMARTFHSPLRPLADIDTVVVTCWYRAPELFLGSRHYTKAIDLFSIGCIHAELLTNVPIFHCPQEQTEQHSRSPYQRKQLEKMFGVLGLPNLKDWEDFKLMPKYVKVTSEFVKSAYRSCNLTKYMKTFNIIPKDRSFFLLKNLLAMDPNRRMKCNEALSDVYFQDLPCPTEDVFSCFPVIPFPKRPYLTTSSHPPGHTKK